MPAPIVQGFKRRALFWAALSAVLAPVAVSTAARVAPTRRVFKEESVEDLAAWARDRLIGLGVIAPAASAAPAPRVINHVVWEDETLTHASVIDDVVLSFAPGGGIHIEARAA